MKKFLVLLYALFFLGACSQNKPADTKVTNPSKLAEKHGKPTIQDVLVLIMQNCNVPLDTADTGCAKAGRSPEEGAKIKTLGEYLSIYWQDHTDTSGHNYINVQIEEGKNADIQEKHWKITFELRGKVEEDPWNWGVRFYLLDKNRNVWKNYFQCIGVG